MKQEAKEATILQKDKNYVKFHRLLQKAEADGRLDGKFRCPVCGMRYLSEREADDCCRIISE
jgi:rubrerythrin